jgi:3'-5' exonuclease
MNITFDIETLPTNDAEVIAEFEKTIQPPANYSKPETIEKWMSENKASALAEKVAKTSFDGLYGRVACIAWGDDQGIFASGADMSEGDAIQLFFDYVANQREVVFIGHNIAGFDLPFLKHRSIILGIKPPRSLLYAMNAKPWDTCIQDTMLLWSTDREKRVSMDKLCKAFGIQGKGDFDGSMVAAEWIKNPQRVIDYCKEDIARTMQIYNRMTFNF